MSDEQLATPADIEKNPSGVVKRWLLELKQADKRERKWREKATSTLKRYRQKDNKAGSFNILWSNTETLRPAIYAKLPTPDVRRRWREDDALGKTVGEVLERCTTFGLEDCDADTVFKAVALDVLLPGRGSARVRYVPTTQQAEPKEQQDQPETEGYEADDSDEGYTEEVTWQQAPVEQVQWDDVRIGPGKCWKEVPWVAFRHRMPQSDLVEKFGALGKKVPLDDVDEEELQGEDKKTAATIFRTAEVWEIWDKEGRECIFIAPQHKAEPLKTEPDPLQLRDFFPMPRPVYAIEDASSLEPQPIYELYREQADELDKISGRITKIVTALKVRGVYDATIAELSQVMRGSDNDLIPAQNVSALMDRGGLDKAIWMLPIEASANVLKVLFEQREQCKQVIYEITGVSDIMRGNTEASETLGAQQLKSSWGTLRLQRLQREMQRFIRDIINIQAEVVGQNFLPATLAAMSGVKLPTGQEKAQLQAKINMAAQHAAQTGQQVPPEVQQQAEQQLAVPSWDEVIACMQDDMQRKFRIDIETDSTIADHLQTDMAGLQEVLTGLVNFIQGIGPAVQMQAFPIEGVKAIVMTICRRARMGLEVEDAMQMIKQPPPPPAQPGPPPDNSLQVEQVKQQAAQALQDMKDQNAAALALAIAKLEAETKVIVAEITTQADQQTKLQTANLQAQTTAMTLQAENARTAQAAAAEDAKPKDTSAAETQQALAMALDGFRTALEGHAEALVQMRAPRTIMRDASGRVAGIQ